MELVTVLQEHNYRVIKQFDEIYFCKHGFEHIIFKISCKPKKYVFLNIEFINIYEQIELIDKFIKSCINISLISNFKKFVMGYSINSKYADYEMNITLFSTHGVRITIDHELNKRNMRQFILWYDESDYNSLIKSFPQLFHYITF